MWVILERSSVHRSIYSYTRVMPPSVLLTLQFWLLSSMPRHCEFEINLLQKSDIPVIGVQPCSHSHRDMYINILLYISEDENDLWLYVFHYHRKGVKFPRHVASQLSHSCACCVQ